METQIRRLANSGLLMGLCSLPADTPRAQTRAQEREAAHRLLCEMLGRETAIRHNADGAPLIDGYHISISHTRGFLVILLSERDRVGVDIEYRSDRVRRIASRFLREDERASELDEMLLCWCAKEAAYKLRSEAHLTYEQMRVRLDQSLVEDLLAGDAVPFSCEVTPDYVLVWLSEDSHMG